MAGKQLMVSTSTKALLRALKTAEEKASGRYISWDKFMIDAFKGKAALAQIAPDLNDPPSPDAAVPDNVTEETAPEAALEQTATAKKEKEKMNEKTEPQHCPECAKKDDELRQALSALSAAEERAKYAEDIANQPVDIPPLSEIIAHCEGGQCPGHAAQWQAIKTQIVEESWKNIPDDVLEAQGIARGLVPTRIVIKES